MPYWAVYETSTGELRSHGTVVADPLPAGLATVDVGSPPGDAVWDKATRSFKPRPAETVRTLRGDFAAQPEITALTTAQRTKVLAALDRVLPDHGMA